MPEPIADALRTLEWHYGTAYAMAYENGKWKATRLDAVELLKADPDAVVELEADDPIDLMELMWRDNAARPVPRPEPEQEHAQPELKSMK